MFTVWLILLILGLTLGVLIFVGTMFFQGYIYTEPSSGLAWRAPAAAVALTAFFALWSLMVIASGQDQTNIPYDTLFRFNARDNLSKEPFRELTAVIEKKVKEKDKESEIVVRTEQVHYVRKKDNAGKTYYAEASGAHRPWNRNDVRAISVKYNGVNYFFEEVKAESGKYREFVTKDGWVLVEYENGPNGQATCFRLGRLAINLFLNFFHISLWFICFWLLLRFQWGHALGLACVMWLIMSIAVLPMIFEQAGRTNSPAAQQSVRKESRPHAAAFPCPRRAT